MYVNNRTVVCQLLNLVFLALCCCSFRLMYGVEVEDLSQRSQHIEQELVSTDEVDGDDTYAMALVNSHALRCEEVDNSNQHGVHDEVGEEDAKSYASWRVHCFHGEPMDVARVHQLLTSEEANEEQVREQHFEEAQNEADEVGHLAVAQDVNDELVHVINHGSPISCLSSLLALLLLFCVITISIDRIVLSLQQSFPGSLFLLHWTACLSRRLFLFIR